MNIQLQENGDLAILEIHPLLVDFIIEGMQQAEADWVCVTHAFLRSPQAEDARFSEDWKEYVQPGLLILLQSCHARVIMDLERMKKEQLQTGESAGARLLIPALHREAWLRILNVRRLSLAAEHQLTEEEINGQVTPDIYTEKGKILVQLQVFSLIQQSLVEVELE